MALLQAVLFFNSYETIVVNDCFSLFLVMRCHEYLSI